MADELTTRPMLDELLEAQRHFALQLTELLDAVATLSVKQDGLAARQEQFAAKQEDLAAKQDKLAARQEDLAAKQDKLAARQEDFAAKQDELAARQDRLELAVMELTREVRNGFDDTARKIDVLNSRLLTFETKLKRIDDRLHDEILARTR